jgi:hypothetical protein
MEYHFIVTEDTFRDLTYKRLVEILEINLSEKHANPYYFRKVKESYKGYFASKRDWDMLLFFNPPTHDSTVISISEASVSKNNYRGDVMFPNYSLEEQLYVINCVFNEFVERYGPLNFNENLFEFVNEKHLEFKEKELKNFLNF